jgi:voltage-gated potassium channel
MVAAVVFLAAYAVPVLGPDLPSWLLSLCQWLSWISWAFFVIDFVVRLALADERLRFLVRHWYDVLVIVLPLLRPLRLLRLIPLLSVLNRRAQTRLRGRVAIYVAGGASLLAFCAALAVLDVERSSSDANITDFGDAIWWAVSTMTTVGYGDRYPVTGVGRMVAFALMVGGIALLGTVTATLASWLIESVEAEKEQAEDLKSPFGDWRTRSTDSRPRRTTTPARAVAAMGRSVSLCLIAFSSSTWKRRRRDRNRCPSESRPHVGGSPRRRAWARAVTLISRDLEAARAWFGAPGRLSARSGRGPAGCSSPKG